MLRFAPLAARRAATLGSHQEAVAQYERALRFAGGLPPADRRCAARPYASELFVVYRSLDPLEVSADALACGASRVSSADWVRRSAIARLCWSRRRRGSRPGCCHVRYRRARSRWVIAANGRARTRRRQGFTWSGKLCGVPPSGCAGRRLAEQEGDEETTVQLARHDRQRTRERR